MPAARSYSRSRLTRSAIGGCVEKSFVTPPPENGLTMYSVSVAGFTSSRARVQQYGVLEDLLDTGPTEFEVPVAGPRFEFVFPSYSITVLTLRSTRQ